MRLGAALEAAGEPEKALAAYRRVYYEYPLSTQAVDAQSAHRTPRDAVAHCAGSVQARARARGAAVPGAPLGAGARGVRAAGARGRQGRRGAGGAAARRMRLLPRPPSRGARRAAAVPARRVARGGGALLPPDGDAGARRQRHLRHAGAAAGRRFSGQQLGGGDAQQPRLALHHGRGRRRGGPGLPRAGAALSARTVRGSRGVEDRLGARTSRAISPRPPRVSRPRRRRFRAPTTGRRGCTGPRGRAISWDRAGRGQRAVPGRRRRLPELVLRTPGVARCWPTRREPPVRPIVDVERATRRQPAPLVPNDAVDPRARRGRAVRRRAARSGVREAGVGRLAGAAGDGRLDPPSSRAAGERRRPLRRPARRDHHDAPRVSAVPGGRRRAAAAGRAAHHLPARLLAAHQEVLGRARPRSVPDDRADRAGIHVHRRRAVVGQRRRPDAAHSGDGAPLRVEARHPLFEPDPDAAGDEHPARACATSRT